MLENKNLKKEKLFEQQSVKPQEENETKLHYLIVEKNVPKILSEYHGRFNNFLQPGEHRNILHFWEGIQDLFKQFHRTSRVPGVQGKKIS